MRAPTLAAFALAALLAPLPHGMAAAQELLGGRAASAATSFEVGTDRPGSDMFVRAMPGGDAADCQALCAATPDCRAFTFDRTADPTAAVCRIKDAAPPAISAACCISGVRDAEMTPVALAPVARMSAPAPAPASGIVTTWPPDTVAARNGFGLCLDVKDGLPNAAAPARPMQMWDCHGGENQRLMLRGGVLVLGASQTVVIAPAEPPRFGACATTQWRAPKRTYAMHLCRGEFASFQILANGAGATLETRQPAATPVAGVPLEARLVTWDRPAAPQWEHVVATGQIRLIGSGLCITAPMDDSGAGAPVYLDDCTAPLAGPDGARASPDGRSRFEPVSAAAR